MGILYFFAACAIFAILLMIIIASELWLNSSYKNTNIIVRWLVFLPISIIRAGLVAVAVTLNTLYIAPLNPHFVMFLNWVAMPLVLFYTISKTLPQGKKIVPLVLCIIWLALNIFELIRGSQYTVMIILQSLGVNLCCICMV